MDASGSRLATSDIVRCKDLVIPRAWEAVWICQYPNGHIQAIGVDAAGRKQYFYHPRVATPARRGETSAPSPGP